MYSVYGPTYHKRVTYALLLNFSDQKIPREPLTINVFLRNEIGVDRKTYVVFLKTNNTLILFYLPQQIKDEFLINHRFQLI